MGPMSAEATVVRNYIDWIISIPWNNNLESDINLVKALKSTRSRSLWSFKS